MDNYIYEYYLVVGDLWKNCYKFVLAVILLLLIFWLPLPYYVDAPGGLTNLNKKVLIDGKKIDGSYNLTYVSEYKASIPLVIYSFFNKDYDVYKKEDILLDSETDKDYYERDRLFLDESLSNAVLSAYNLADKKVTKKNNYLYVGYILEDSETDLIVGDSIISIDGIKVSTKEEINKLLNTKKANDRISIKVKNGKKEYVRYAYLKEKNKKIVIGIIPIEVYDYETNPKVKIKTSPSESGGSGGLMLALSIYDLLEDKNVARGRVIAGTGTIDSNGNVGKIDGVKYKIKGAVKKKADIFFVPNDNYKEALKIVKKNKYNIKLVNVDNLKDAVTYLNK